MDLAAFEPYLRGLAHIKIEPDLRADIDVADLVQKTFQKAVRCLPQFRGTTSGERAAWLKQILIHTLQDEIRSLRRIKRDKVRAIDKTSRRILDALPVDRPGPFTHAGQLEEADRLAEAIARLPADQRLTVELHALQQYSLAETSARMGKSEGAVSSLFHRAVLALRQDLGGNGRP